MSSDPAARRGREGGGDARGRILPEGRGVNGECGAGACRCQAAVDCSSWGVVTGADVGYSDFGGNRHHKNIHIEIHATHTIAKLLIPAHIADSNDETSVWKNRF